MEFGALLSIEVGKNRLEALGDVEETADLIRWSCDMVEQNDGFDDPMGNLGDPTVHTRSVLKPYGVWGVISPFNFPFALSGGPAGGALVAGNTVVYKPSSDAPLSGSCLTPGRCATPGVPDGVFNMVMGPGETVGDELQTNPGVDGIIFTGSFEVGFGLYKSFAKAYPKPVIVEMGGKNPAIVTAPRRPRRGGRGRSCARRSASRARSARPTAASTSSARSTTSSSGGSSRRPRRSRSATPPTGATGSARSSTRRRSRATSRRSPRSAATGAWSIGGERLTEHGLDSGFFVAPTVALDLPTDHRLFRDELFLPVHGRRAGRLDRRGAPPVERQRSRA